MRSTAHLTRSLLTLALALPLVLAAGCGGLGGILGPDEPPAADPPPRSAGTRVGELVGDVVEVDAGRRELVLDTDAERRDVTLVYDDDTPVYFEGQRYRVANLERGDRIRVDVSEDRKGTRYADRIEVVRDVRAGGGWDDDGAADGDWDDDDRSWEDDRGREDDARTVTGEVVRVDAVDLRLTLETDDRRTVTLRYDREAPVYYRGQRYRVANLEPGDVVRVEVSEDRGGERYAGRIEVVQSIQERTGERDDDGGSWDDDRSSWPDQRAERWEGRITWIDERQGWFGLDTGRGVFTVEMPYGADRDDRERFGRLRRGQRVTIEAERTADDRLLLVRFD